MKVQSAGSDPKSRAMDGEKSLEQEKLRERVWEAVFVSESKAKKTVEAAASKVAETRTGPFGRQKEMPFPTRGGGQEQRNDPRVSLHVPTQLCKPTRHSLTFISQFVPLNPGKQLHAKDPAVLKQDMPTPPPLQLWVPATHSLISSHFRLDLKKPGRQSHEKDPGVFVHLDTTLAQL